MLTTTLQPAIEDMTRSRSGDHGAWLHVVSHLDPKYGGLSAVVPQLALSAAAERREAPKIAAFCAPGEMSTGDGLGDEIRDEIDISAWPTSRLAWMRDAELGRRFDGLVRGSAGVHIHGLWETSTAVAVRSARRAGVPYVVSAHGMLEPWALRNKRLKKQIYAALVERGNVGRARCLLALTEAEAADYRRFGARQPIAVIPNGVRIPEDVGPELFLERFPSLAGKRIVLFLGRIHFKKGVDLLVDAWNEIAPRFPNARLVLAGPDFEGTRRTIEDRVAGLGLGASVSFTGMLQGGEKWSALAAAEAFVLPSHSEGLSVSTLEAMGMGLPVVVTTHCHLPEVTATGAGWEIPSEVPALASVLRQLLGNTPARNREMGARGRRLVNERFGWEAIGKQMSDVYRWIEGGPEPSSVRLDRLSGSGERAGGAR